MFSLYMYYINMLVFIRPRSTPCPNVKHGDDWGDPSQCDSGDACPYCHTRTEQQFHPEVHEYYHLLTALESYQIENLNGCHPMWLSYVVIFQRTQHGTKLHMLQLLSSV